MDKLHSIKDIQFNNECLELNIDGEQKSFKLSEISERLDKASDPERMQFVISPSGYGIHWPLIDEDISIDGLLGIHHSPKLEEYIA